MLAAEIWHWWIGVILTAVGVLAVLGLGINFLKLLSTRYPNKRQRQD